MIVPNKGQSECLKKIKKWHKSYTKQSFVFTGPAGTGKTSIVPMCIDEMGLYPHEVLFVAFTGKAASILMMKGFDAYTIHSAFFEMAEVPKIYDNNIVYKNGRMVKKLEFIKKHFIDPSIKLIWIEECGMVNKELADVIYSFDLPVVASGDNYQLPPVFGESPFFLDIDHQLWEITRQAEGNGIILLATRIREGKELRNYMNFNRDAYILSKKYLKKRHLLDADMVLTVKNSTRNVFNNKMRELKGSYGPLPNVGDRLVCRRNNRTMSLEGIPLTNGTIGKVVNPISRSDCNLKNGIYRIDFQPDYIDGYSYYESMPCDYNFLKEPCGNKTVDKYNFGMKMEYAEAISVHLSQGSQYPNITYWDEWVGDKEYMKKVRYTAVTRAINKAFMFV